MIHFALDGTVAWGTDATEGPDGAPGRRMNFKDGDSGIVFSVAFSGEPLAQLVSQLAEGLTPAQKRDLMPSFAGGIILPGLPGNNFEKGPQG